MFSSYRHDRTIIVFDWPFGSLMMLIFSSVYKQCTICNRWCKNLTAASDHSETPRFKSLIMWAQGTRPNTLCTAVFTPSWSSVVVKYTSWTCYRTNGFQLFWSCSNYYVITELYKISRAHYVYNLSNHDVFEAQELLNSVNWERLQTYKIDDN